jgi:serine/threonine-protein kinase
MQTGTRLGHYEILSAIGKGGMGEVWKARDTKLRRDVAVKTLPPEFAQNADRLARLEREATSLAAINHPNIASIYGLEEHAGTRYLVLELVDGETLADRLRKGAIPLEPALKIALQIAEALEAAHEKGVVHRDLKPANVKVTADGRVKVLDFGIAKTLTTRERDAATQLTLHGDAPALIGTPAYMSPEQARGEAVNRQTDIWSFGVVLYEMLTGDSPFDRGTATETLARVLEAQPDFSLLPAATPASTRHLLKRCLEKDQKRRFRDSGDVRIEIEDALAVEPARPAAAARGPLRRVAGALMLVGLVAFAGVGVWSLTERGANAPRPDVVRLSIASLPPRVNPIVGGESLALSPDGTRFAYSSLTNLLIRRMDGQGTDVAPGGTGITNPFFSPDGEWIGFFDDGLRRAPSAGGPAILITASTERPAGATWGIDDTIVYATTAGLYRIGTDGGEPRLLARPALAGGERLYAWPRFLPDGQSVLFTILPQESINGAQIAWLDLETLETKHVLTGGIAARYVPTGHLVYVAGQALMAVAFDLRTREARGSPVAMPGINVATSPDNGAAEFAISSTGTLAFISPTAPARASLSTLTWVDRDGNEEPLPLAPGNYVYPRISPDGTRIAIDIRGENRDIWIWDIERASLARLTDGPTEDITPVWTRDGERVFFASDRAGNFDVYSQSADGAGEARVEIADPKFQYPASFSPDGTQLVVNEEFVDLSILDLTQQSLKPLLHRDAVDFASDLSADGNWIAYESDESDAQWEIYLRPFPEVGEGREKVSVDGGRYPRWGPAGSGELYYVALGGGMMAVTVDSTPSLRIGRATKLFDTAPPQRGRQNRDYDVAPDGRFIIVKPTAATSSDSLNVSVVLNWFEELREQMPRP